ncbi:MAG: MerP protein [Bacteroidetes bacterium]|nr:MAG: MerP protein [Bacteroidota bacterium]RLD78134.1 MAG: MerP protein [Bacteroidota bacterium]
MKTSVKILLIAFLAIMFSSHLQAQDPEPKTKEIKIQTSAICGMCEERIESNMAFEKGVTSVELDDKTKIVTITYRTAKTDPKKLREAISKLGYDADDVEADPKAYAKLPACCQKGVAPH